MLVTIIQSASADSPPIYYAPSPGVVTAWTEDKDAALGFPSAGDAQRFIDAMLPRMVDSCRPIMHARKG